MKHNKKIKNGIFILAAGCILLFACEKGKTVQTQPETENTQHAASIDAAMSNLFLYHDSLVQDYQHAMHKVHHHDSIYHHHDSTYHHHHSQYHHGDTAHHHHGFHHNQKQHNQHDSLAKEHHKLVH